MLSNLLLVVVTFAIGWILSAVVSKRKYARKMVRVFNHLGITSSEIKTAVANIAREDAVSKFNNSNDSIDTLSEMFTFITITREGKKVYAYEGEKFIAQADSVEELHKYVLTKFDAIAFITEDKDISVELARIENVSDNVA